MTVRKLEREERFEGSLISAFCFHVRIDDLEKARERAEAGETETWGAFTEDGTLAARIVNNPYEFCIDGTPVKAGGIGGVSTLPEYRNSGAIRDIFRELLPEAYRNGEVISALYPFNHGFYRKQGYDTVTFRNVYRMEPALLECYKTDCKAIMWKPGDDVKEHLSVYSEFIKNYNLAAPRDEECMKAHISAAPYKSRQFTYLFRKEGKGVAYMIVQDMQNDPQAILRVEEAAWTCREGFEAILAFLGRFDADYMRVDLPLPRGIDLFRILRTRRAYDVEKITEMNYMVRVINAQKLLEVIKKKPDTDFTVKLQDDIIAENNGIFRVTADKITRLDSAERADIEISEPSFAQLAVGAISLDEAMLKPDVKVNGNTDMLENVFKEKKIFINEHF